MAADLALREALRAYDDDDEDDDGGGGVGGIGGSEPPRPNAVTFGVVMSAWGRQQRRHQRRNRRQRQPRGGRRGRDRGDPDDSEEEKEDPASRALSLLGEMAARYAATGDPAWRPNAYVVCGAARILARSGGGGGGGAEGGGGEAAVRGADALLRSLEGMALPGSGSGGGGNGGGNGGAASARRPDPGLRHLHAGHGSVRCGRGEKGRERPPRPCWIGWRPWTGPWQP